MKRLFFALPCPNECRQTVLEWRQHHLAALKSHWVDDANLHITLAFLGAVEDMHIGTLTAIGDSIQSHSFTIQLDRAGEFGGGKYLWIGPSQPPGELMDLVGKLNQELDANGYPVDQRPYRPHLTLARKAPAGNLPEDPNGIEWPATSFGLYESVQITGGVCYNLLKEWPLETGGTY